MREGWTETTLGDVAAWFSGGTPKAGRPEFYENGTFPWVVIADMMKTEIFSTASKITAAGLAEIGGKLAPQGSVLISMYATVGRPGFAHMPVATNQAIAWSIPNPKLIVSRFLLLIAQHLEPTISSMARGATQRNINRAMLREFSFNLPPLVEQERIVDVVSSVDAYIDALQQQADTACEARNAVLHELLSAGGDDWTETTLGDIAQWQGGITPSMANNEFWENGTIPWVSSGDVLQLNLRGAQKFVTVISLKETSLKLLPVGTVVVVVRSGILIHTLPIAILESPSTINQDIKAGVPRSDVLGQFLLWVLRSNSRVILESCRKTGTTVQSISTDAFLKFPVLLPPLDEQKRIVEIVSSMDEVIQATEQSVSGARNLRSGLLSELLSGEHEIPESYDKFVGAA